MSTNSTRRQQVAMSLRDKEYRDAFVSEHIDNAVAFQVRAMREARQWSQKDLGRRAGMAQERVSVLEDPDYGRMSLSTLKRLASALDVALVVRFAPFSELVDWAVDVSPEALAVPDFEHDPGLQVAVAALSTTQATRLALPLHGTESVPLGDSVKATIGRVFRAWRDGASAGAAFSDSTAGAPLVAVNHG